MRIERIIYDYDFRDYKKEIYHINDDDEIFKSKFFIDLRNRIYRLIIDSDILENQNYFHFLNLISEFKERYYYELNDNNERLDKREEILFEYYLEKIDSEYRRYIDL